MEIVRIGNAMYGYQEGYLYYLTTESPRLNCGYQAWEAFCLTRELLI